MLRGLVILSLFALAIGCGDDDAPDAPPDGDPPVMDATVDGPTLSPDAMASRPDATVGRPDATVGRPDAMMGRPDAAPMGCTYEGPASVGRCTIAPRITCMGMTIDSVDLSCADISNSNWSLATLRLTSLMRANLTNTNLMGATIAGCRFGDATLMGTDLRRANIRDTNFMGADLSGAMLDRSTIMVNVTCPDGTNSDSHGMSCDGHLSP